MIGKYHNGMYIEIEPELLWSLYWGNQYSTTKMAEIFNCSNSTIHDKLIKNDDNTR